MEKILGKLHPSKPRNVEVEANAKSINISAE